MKDTHSKLPVALILKYKRSTHAKKKRVVNQGEKSERKTQEKQNSR